MWASVSSSGQLLWHILSSSGSASSRTTWKTHRAICEKKAARSCTVYTWREFANMFTRANQ